ncbi:hypothetical protein ABZ208_31005 [Streptomyces sp. NPDC006208]|uniref:hypothetical protein n=1 Tax=Streptomyces sp. NPDC006208 TaxID=3156734 RepID=UPI0033A25E09
MARPRAPAITATQNTDQGQLSWGSENTRRPAGEGFSLPYVGVMGVGTEALIVDRARMKTAAAGDREDLLIDAALGEVYSDDPFPSNSADPRPW